MPRERKRFWCVLALTVFFAMLGQVSNAQPLYRCTYPDGSIHWQDRPCASGQGSDAKVVAPSARSASVVDVERQRRLQALEAERAQIASERAALRERFAQEEQRWREQTPPSGLTPQQRLEWERLQASLWRERERRYRDELKALEARDRQIRAEISRWQQDSPSPRRSSRQ